MPNHQPKDEELKIYDEISLLAKSLWEASKVIEGLNTDPKMFSIVLFKRLWSNHRAFTLLWNNDFRLEGDIVLRSGLEAAICIAANFHLREDFVHLMRRDAAFSVQSDIKMVRDTGAKPAVAEAGAVLRMLVAGIPDGVKAAKLDWKVLAEQGGAKHLYGFHRALSGRSSHVTGLSILPDFASVDGTTEKQDELKHLTKKMHLMMMAGATLHGSLIHAQMIDDQNHVGIANGLVERLNVLSKKWPGVPQ
jgi:hypothetical protein